MKNPSNRDWKSMESEWKEKMQEATSPVSEGLWEKLSARLDAEEKPKVFSIKTWRWAAVFILAVGLSWIWFLPNKDQVAQHAKTTLEVPHLSTSQIQHKNKLKSIPTEKIKVTSIITQSQQKEKISLVPKIEKPEIVVPTIQHVIVQQSPPSPSILAEEKGAEKEEVIWVQVKIDPLLPADEDRPTLTGRPTENKRNLGQLLKKIKQVIKGNPGEWSEIKENFHLVANKYVQTEETIKQKIQFQ